MELQRNDVYQKIIYYKYCPETTNPSPNPTNTPSRSPTNVPTKSPSLSPSRSPTISIDYEMVKLNGSFICADVTANIAQVYGISYEDCVYGCLHTYPECRMINYIYSSNPRRCYIFDHQCSVYEDIESDNNVVAIKGDESVCIDYPSNWFDKLGDTCSQYSGLLNYCQNGSIPNNVTMSDIESNANVVPSLDGMDTCCQCGGGVDIIDNIEITYSYASHAQNDTISPFNSDDLLCSWPWNEHEAYDQNSPIHRTWDNLFAYNLCRKMDDKLSAHGLDCHMLVNNKDETNNFVICDFTEYQQTTSEDVYFLYMMGIDIDPSKAANIYFNSHWFNLDESLIPGNIQNASYSQCISSILASSSELYAIIPCDEVTDSPTNQPTAYPTSNPTSMPTTISPTNQPTPQPTSEILYEVTHSICGDGYKLDDSKHCVPCDDNEAGMGGICEQCRDGKEANHNNTECTFCSGNFIGVEGVCNIDCSLTNKIANEIHTECIEAQEKELFYETSEFDAIVSVLSIVGFGSVLAIVAYCKKKLCWSDKTNTSHTTAPSNELTTL